jgi:tetratricopeptide (TPR) repeat protein
LFERRLFSFSRFAGGHRICVGEQVMIRAANLWTIRRATVVSVMLVALAGHGYAQTPQEAFDAIFGDSLEAVRRTRDSADDAELAWRLVRLAEENGEWPELAAMMCQQAYALSANVDDELLPIRALEQVALYSPDQSLNALEAMADIRGRRYDAAQAGLTKRRAGRQYIDTLLALSRRQREAGQYAEAQASLRQATRVAERDVPRREAAVAAALLQLDITQRVNERIDAIMLPLDSALPPDVRDELIWLRLVGLDDPAGAMVYFDGSQDMILQTYVPLAAREVATIPPVTAGELGDWYATLADREGQYVDRAAMLDRARTYYARALTGAADDTTRATLQSKINRIAEAYGDLTGLHLPTNRFRGLMDLVDVPLDIIEGRVSASDDWLVVGAGGRTRLRLPVLLPGSYQLRMRLVRQSGEGAMRVILPVGQQHVVLLLDQEAVAGLEMIDDQPAIRNATGITGFDIPIGEPVALDIIIRRTELASTVVVRINGSQRIRWSGQGNSLAVPEAWAPQQVGEVLLGTAEAVFVVDEIEVKPEDDGAIRLR